VDLFHYLDVAIGFSMVMAILAAVAGAAGQTWLTAFKVRAKKLEAGVAGVVETFSNDAAKLAVAMIGRAKAGWFRAGDADNLSREDTVIALLRAAVSTPKLVKLPAEISDPAKALADVEAEILKQETARPDLPAQVWKTNALAQVVPKLAAPVFAQFDAMLDRVNDDAAAHGRFVSMAGAFVFIFAFYPVDSITLLSRLAQDKRLAASIAERAEKARSSPETATSQQQLDELVTQNLFGQMNQGLCHLPDNIQRSGVWVTWVLVSLGAPFWLSALERALGFRSRLAKNVSDQQTLRQQAQPPPAGQPPPGGQPPGANP
jgi:hypothetical protein